MLVETSYAGHFQTYIGVIHGKRCQPPVPRHLHPRLPGASLWRISNLVTLGQELHGIRDGIIMGYLDSLE
jgi:hypothetical protein